MSRSWYTAAKTKETAFSPLFYHTFTRLAMFYMLMSLPKLQSSFRKEERMLSLYSKGQATHSHLYLWRVKVARSIHTYSRPASYEHAHGNTNSLIHQLPPLSVRTHSTLHAMADSDTPTSSSHNQQQQQRNCSLLLFHVFHPLLLVLFMQDCLQLLEKSMFLCPQRFQMIV